MGLIYIVLFVCIFLYQSNGLDQLANVVLFASFFLGSLFSSRLTTRVSCFLVRGPRWLVTSRVFWGFRIGRYVLGVVFLGPFEVFRVFSGRPAGWTYPVLGRGLFFRGRFGPGDAFLFLFL